MLLLRIKRLYEALQAGFRRVLGELDISALQTLVLPRMRTSFLGIEAWPKNRGGGWRIAGGLPFRPCHSRTRRLCFQLLLFDPDLYNQTHQQQPPEQKGNSSDGGLDAGAGYSHKKTARVPL